MNTNRLIFSEMKHTINEEQNNLINSLDNLKNKVHSYFGEDSLGKNEQHSNTIKRPDAVNLQTYSPEKRNLMEGLVNTLDRNYFNN